LQLTLKFGYGGCPYRHNYAATNEPGWFTFNGLVTDVGRDPIARAQLPERIASGTHSCWAPGESIAGW
jgi:carotenoid cleavage dioxygenase-like enzyme